MPTTVTESNTVDSPVVSMSDIALIGELGENAPSFAEITQSPKKSGISSSDCLTRAREVVIESVFEACAEHSETLFESDRRHPSCECHLPTFHVPFPGRYLECE